MAGRAGAGSPTADDHVVQPGEKIWRLTDPNFYQSDPNIPNSRKEVLPSAFSGEVSAFRASLTSLISEAIIDSALNGKFANWRIAELSEVEIRRCGCALKLDVQPEWHPDVHVLIVKESTGKRLNPTLKKALADLANKRPLKRTPK